jgi:microcystin degradation protein MlrC
VRHADVVLPSFNMRTSGGPMCELERLAREASTGSILEVGVFGGFPYADTVHTGASVFVVSDAAHDPQGAEAQHVAARMTAEIARRAPAFEVTLPGPAEAIRLALATPGDGLVAVTDPADNPLSGGGCDTPALFRALLDARVQAPALFASFADPVIVAAAKRAGIATSIDITLGARFGEHFGCGVEVHATVERLTDGEFRNAGPMEYGVVRRCGSTALLRIEGARSLRVIVTADVVPADDPAFYALHGIDPSTLRLLCVKAKNHFRAAFAGRCRAIIDCDAPGPACVDLSRLPFRNVPAARLARR